MAEIREDQLFGGNFSMLKSVTVLCLLAIFSGCSRMQEGDAMFEDSITLGSIENITPEALAALSSSRIFFGHQSVGDNIVKGINAIAGEKRALQLNVVDTKSISAKTGPVFAHSKVGKNLDPLSKINEFSSIVEKDMGNKADIAFFKFCYVDFSAHGEVETIFQHYRETLSRLREAYPGTTFIHFTTPLVRREKGLKTVIKQFLGRDRTGYEDNLVRHRFNELLRNEYGNREPLFDLALLESTHSNGKTQYYSEGSQKYYSLYDGYTTDGGHLNAKGSRFIAEQLLVYIAGVLGKNQ